MTDLFVKLKKHEAQKLPYVVYCKPNSDRVVGVFQNTDELYFLENFDEKGFVFAPFDGDKRPYIPQEKSDVYVEKIHAVDYFFETKIETKIDKKAKETFGNLVSKAIDCISKSIFEKVVVSRKENYELKNFDTEIAFKKMLFFYPNAFKYCFYHPKIGKWIGATPEQFLKIDTTVLQTVALAGTQSSIDEIEPKWADKEIHEQQLVTDFIINGLNDFCVDVKASNPYSVKAGNLWHIKTDITANLMSKNALKEVIERMHPTSAVCGLPKDVAKDFILKNEGYEREYYSGFLGELNIDFTTFKTSKTDLFVNLRCMKIEENIASLFIGCGIVYNSNPSNEFIETVNKSMVMKKIIN